MAYPLGTSRTNIECGHSESPHYSIGKCKSCYEKDYYAKNRDSRNKVEYRNRKRNRHLTKTYGITQSEYESIAESQSFMCAICSRPRQLQVDHNHQTGSVRGLLCSKCNTTLGLLDDDPDLFERAAEYVRTR